MALDRSAPDRSYKDANHKPELLVAIEPTEALCGFRSILSVRGLAHGLGSAAWQELVERTCGPGSDDTSGLRALLTELLTCGGPHLAGLVADVLAAGAELSPADAALTGPVRWVHRLADLFPGDPGVLAPLLLELVRLEPGDGLFVAAGVLHSYLHGAGVEVQATSDNVLRGGLTGKHVDVPELLRTVRFEPASAVPAGGASAGRRRARGVRGPGRRLRGVARDAARRGGRGRPSDDVGLGHRRRAHRVGRCRRCRARSRPGGVRPRRRGGGRHRRGRLPGDLDAVAAAVARAAQAGDPA